MSRFSIVAFATLALSACRSESPATDNAAPAAREPEPAVAAPAAAGTTTETTAPANAPNEDLELSGVAAPMRYTRLSAKSGGILASIKTREGTYAEAGQVLCQLDTTDLQIRLDGARVAYAQAVANAQNSKGDLKRAKDLFKGGSNTEVGVEKAQFASTIADLQADGARVALHAAEQAFADASLRAPFSGVVTKVLAEEGQMITTMPPSIIFALADVKTLEVRVPVPERLLSRIKVGQPVAVVFPAVNAERQAKIDRIPEVIDSATRSVDAVIRLDNADRSLPAGLYVRVRFTGIKADTGGTELAAGTAAGTPEVQTP